MQEIWQTKPLLHKVREDNRGSVLVFVAVTLVVVLWMIIFFIDTARAWYFGVVAQEMADAAALSGALTAQPVYETRIVTRVDPEGKLYQVEERYIARLELDQTLCANASKDAVVKNIAVFNAERGGETMLVLAPSKAALDGVNYTAYTTSRLVNGNGAVEVEVTVCLPTIFQFDFGSVSFKYFKQTRIARAEATME